MAFAVRIQPLYNINQHLMYFFSKFVLSIALPYQPNSLFVLVKKCFSPQYFKFILTVKYSKVSVTEMSLQIHEKFTNKFVIDLESNQFHFLFQN